MPRLVELGEETFQLCVLFLWDSITDRLRYDLVCQLVITRGACTGDADHEGDVLRLRKREWHHVSSLADSPQSDPPVVDVGVLFHDFNRIQDDLGSLVIHACSVVKLTVNSPVPGLSQEKTA